MPLYQRELTSRSTLETLRRDAKRWLRQLDAAEPAALDRFRAALPGGSARPGLREVQQALSREYGFASWAALKQALADREIAARGLPERVTLFLEKAALRYRVAPGTQTWGHYETDRPARGALAARLLARHPEIARVDLHAAVAAQDLAAVRGILARDPAAADRPGGPDGWTPLLRLAYTRLAYTRLPVEATSGEAVAIATLLLDHGASPTAFWTDGSNHFTVLTGAIGGGEGAQPPHPQAEALVRLLLARGADPLDGQALYNTSLGADDPAWLELLWQESARRGETARWREPVRELNGPPLDYLLGNAVPHHPRRAAWLLAHGARADSVNGYSRRSVIHDALLGGCDELVALLRAGGAEPPALSEGERFVAAMARGDEAEARRLLAAHPDCRADPRPLFAAIRQGRPEIAALALRLGLSPDGEGGDAVRPLHEAAGANAVEIARLLVEAGAEIDAAERRFGGTPLTWAHHNGTGAAVPLLAPLSRDLAGLCWAHCLERLRSLLAEDAGLADRPTPDGEPPLFHLPDEDEQAFDVAELLLAAGADASRRNAGGETPAEAARRRGLYDTADLLEAAPLKASLPATAPGRDR